MSIDQLELVGRSSVPRGRFKLTPDKTGKKIQFPPGTIILAATGPHPRDVRYGDTSSTLVLEHPDIRPVMEGSEYPVLDPQVDMVNDVLVISAWTRHATPDA